MVRSLVAVPGAKWVLKRDKKLVEVKASPWEVGSAGVSALEKVVSLAAGMV